MAFSKVKSGIKEFPSASVLTLRRLKIALFATCVVPLLLFVAGAWDERTQLLHAGEGEVLASVATLREHALKTIETDDLLIREVDDRIQGMSWDEIRSSSAVLSHDIGAMHAGMKQVSLMTVADADGRVWAASPPHRTDGSMSISQMDVWSAQREADRGTFFSGAYVGKLTGQVNFGISRRRTTPDGRFDGTIHVAVAASYFSTFWSQVIGGKEGAAIALVRTDGEILARFPNTDGPPPGRIPQSSNLLRHLAAEPLGGVYRVTSMIDGTDRVYAYARVGTYPLVVGYGLSVYSILAPWRLHLLVLGGIGAVAAGAVALALLAAIRQVHNLIGEQATRAALEEAARKGQRLGLLGQLTAGTAHDFANILQAMQAGAMLIARRADDPDRVRSLARRLGEDAERGASLTHRILDMVRQKPGEDAAGEDGAGASIDPAEVVAGVANLLSRILGGRHRLRLDADPNGLAVTIRTNRIDLEMAVMNLVVNARDAMPDGGEVVIQAAPERIGGAMQGSKDGRPGPALAPGLYIRISVIDSGIGMAPDVLARAGERFFTTKQSGQGTGLGLAGAREFAERIGGTLSIWSEVECGTTVTLWLPAIAPSLAPTRTVAEAVGRRSAVAL